MVAFIGAMVLLLMPVYGNKENFRVIAGKDDVRNKYPFVVTLTNIPFEYRFCTGSLISTEWVLTAAHCFQNKRPEFHFRVRFGDLTAKPRNGTFRRVLGIFRGPSFQTIKSLKYPGKPTVEMPLKNDIALLKIEELDSVPPGKISAVDYRSLIGRSVRYIGTGLTMKDSIMKTEPFQFLLTESKDNRRPRQIGKAVVVNCPKDDPDETKVNAALLCLRPKCTDRYQRAQIGDSGGPLIFKGKIVGLACTVKHVDLHHEAMYTAISPYLEWLQGVITVNEIRSTRASEFFDTIFAK